jgi:hypothetical protein
MIPADRLTERGSQLTERFRLFLDETAGKNDNAHYNARNFLFSRRFLAGRTA